MARNTEAKQYDEAEFFKKLDIEAASPDGVKEFLRMNILADQPCGVFGKAGIGKTQIVTQLGEELDMDVHVLYLQHLDKEDISGFPFPDPNDPNLVTMRLRKLVPLTRSKRKGTILFMDEFNRAERSVVNAAFTIMEKPRRLGDVVLADDVRIVLGANPSDENYNVNEAEKDPAIRRRVTWTGMIASHASFLRHAEKSGYHRSVISYLRRHKQHLYDTEAHNAGRVCATPASWQKVADIITVLEKATSGNLDKVAGPLRMTVAGLIGKSHAHEFMTELLNDDTALVEPEEILDPSFAPGTDAYERVEKLVKSKKAGSSGNIGLLCTSVALTVASTQPAPAAVAPSVAKFSGLLEGDNLQKFFEVLLKSIQEQDADKKYLTAFTKALRDQPEYTAAVRRLSEKASMIDGLKNGKNKAAAATP